MMQILKAFLKEKREYFIILAGMCGIFVLVFWAYDLPLQSVGYGVLLAVLWMAGWTVIKFIAYAKKINCLKENQEKILAEAEGLPESDSLEMKIYQEIIYRLYEEKKESESSEKIRWQEMADYYSMWVHQIKTPITALGVLIQSCEEDMWENQTAQNMLQSMKMETFRIEQYVEMVLTYLRMGEDSSDYFFENCKLEEILKQAIRKYSQIFIMTKTAIQMKVKDEMVLTDRKWLGFVIEQILSNAVKYARGGEITIYMEGRNLLIADNGIGIAEEDLPRIFEKGYTGYNGRADKKSTGIGLYLCKTVMDRLHHKIWIESEPGKGTRVYLNFEREYRRIE